MLERLVSVPPVIIVQATVSDHLGQAYSDLGTTGKGYVIRIIVFCQNSILKKIPISLIFRSYPDKANIL